MQPYFFPYLGYFQLIHAVDRFILFDDVQYIRHGWINRNRILKPSGGYQYINVSLAEHTRETLIRDIHDSDSNDWQGKIKRQLEHYKKKSPYYKNVSELLDTCFAEKESNIAKLNGVYIKNVCNYLSIPFTIELSSEMGFDYSDVSDAGEWALQIGRQVGADTYINPAGGAELFDTDKFSRAGIKLLFLNPDLKPYNQFQSDFEPGLSILDVMMFNSPEDIRRMVNDFHLS